MTLSEQAKRLLEHIKRKPVPVVVSDLFEGHGYEATNHITNAIQELRQAGILFVRSIMYKGRFETELYFEGQSTSPVVTSPVAKKPKVIIKRR